jgi:hypothetical protein
MLVAESDLTIKAGDEIRLVDTVRSNTGDVVISSIDGGLDFGQDGQLVHAVDGGITLASGAGGATLRQLTAAQDIAVNTLLDITFLDHVDAATGDITVRTTSGDLEVRDRMHAVGGSITLDVLDGIADITTLQAGQDITVSVEGISPITNFSATLNTLVAGRSISSTALGSMTILGEHTARTGDISILSRSGAIQLLATDLHAISGRIDVTAHGEILQSATDGIFLVDVINTGEFVAVDTPEVDVAIAEPAAGGGTAAEASAVVRQVGVQRENGQIIIFPQPGVVVEPQPNDVPVWGVVGYLITNPGDGYASGETPAVTIQGLPGASARAVAAGFVPFNVIAEDDVNITAGETVLLRNIVRSNVGSVTISSIDRDVNLSAAGQLVHTLAGDITIESLAGGITFNQLVPGRDLSLESFQPLAINQPLVVKIGRAHV